jgi:leader peptidase (prepilin peptidase)/N-methyltransferase
MDLYTLTAIFSFLLGLVLGSFMNVCIYRLPQNESIVRPPSSCPHCGEQIRFYDNIPLVSYAILGGKCRRCRGKISWRYPTIELMTGFLSLALFIRYGPSYQYLVFLIFVAALVTISFIDLDYQIIPDVISIPGIGAGFAAALLLGQISWVDSLAGIAAGGGSLYLVGIGYKSLTGKEGMGFGDVKLLAMIGAWMGWRPLLLTILISSLSGAVIGTAFLLFSGQSARSRIPFGPFLSLGALVVFFFGPQLTRWYFNLLS